MLASLDITPATLFVLLGLSAAVFAAVYKIMRRGLCNCKNCSGECKSCHVADNMVNNIEMAAVASYVSSTGDGGNFGKSIDDSRGLS